jgi:hypothetical protein
MSNLAFEVLGSCGALVVFRGFYSVDELDAADYFGLIIEAKQFAPVCCDV